MLSHKHTDINISQTSKTSTSTIPMKSETTIKMERLLPLLWKDRTFLYHLLSQLSIMTMIPSGIETESEKSELLKLE